MDLEAQELVSETFKHLDLIAKDNNSYYKDVEFEFEVRKNKDGKGGIQLGLPQYNVGAKLEGHIETFRGSRIRVTLSKKLKGNPDLLGELAIRENIKKN